MWVPASTYFDAHCTTAVGAGKARDIIGTTGGKHGGGGDFAEKDISKIDGCESGANAKGRRPGVIQFTIDP